MKFHWGIKISLLYGLFVLGILSMAAFYMRQEPELVSKEYYNEEIRYQNKIEKLRRTSLLSEKVRLKVSDKKLNIRFPKVGPGDIAGDAFFYRPSDKKSDFRLPVKLDSAYTQAVSFEGRRKGLWKVELNWKAGGKEYLNEEVIYIQ